MLIFVTYFLLVFYFNCFFVFDKSYCFYYLCLYLLHILSVFCIVFSFSRAIILFFVFSPLENTFILFHYLIILQNFNNNQLRQYSPGLLVERIKLFKFNLCIPNQFPKLLYQLGICKAIVHLSPCFLFCNGTYSLRMKLNKDSELSHDWTKETSLNTRLSY